jgi:hypothetical protein
LAYDDEIGFYVDTTRGKRRIKDEEEIEIYNPSTDSLSKYKVKL